MSHTCTARSADLRRCAVRLVLATAILVAAAAWLGAPGPVGAAPRGVVVSPDGRSLYVASTTDDSVTHFARDAEGRLFDRGCVGDGTPGCIQVTSLDTVGTAGLPLRASVTVRAR